MRRNRNLDMLRIWSLTKYQKNFVLNRNSIYEKLIDPLFPSLNPTNLGLKCFSTSARDYIITEAEVNIDSSPIMDLDSEYAKVKSYYKHLLHIYIKVWVVQKGHLFTQKSRFRWMKKRYSRKL
jgi:hypothetical protein